MSAESSPTRRASSRRMSVAASAPGARTSSSAISGLPSTRRMETGQRGRRHPCPGARVHEPPERTDVERTHRELDRLVDRERVHQRGDRLVGLPAAHRRDHLRAAGLEAAQHEREHRRAGGVEPLPVVDGEQDRARQPVEQRERGEARPGAGRPAPTASSSSSAAANARRCGSASRGSPPMAGRSRSSSAANELPASAAVGRARSTRVPAALRLRHGRLEQRRLAHAGVALEEGDDRPPGSLHDSPGAAGARLPAR